jgi:hypothetical protein
MALQCSTGESSGDPKGFFGQRLRKIDGVISCHFWQLDKYQASRTMFLATVVEVDPHTRFETRQSCTVAYRSACQSRRRPVPQLADLQLGAES